MANNTIFDLNIYLAKLEIKNSDECIKNVNRLDKKDIGRDLDMEASLYIHNTIPNPPTWSKFFQDSEIISELGENQSTGAILAISSGKRIFLLTFGQEWRNIDDMKIETDFGLKTALNILDPDSIKSIDKSTLEIQSTKTREQSARGTKIRNFDIDIEKDLLQSITGTPKADEVFGKRVSGKKSLKLLIEMQLKDLPNLLNEIIKRYESDDYKKGPFSWVDYIEEVRNKNMIEDLDKMLIKKINGTTLDPKIFLSSPEIIDWNDTTGFKYPSGTEVHDVDITEFIEDLKDKKISYEYIKKEKIDCIKKDEHGDIIKIVYSKTVYHYFHAEISKKGSKTYFLNDGKWYQIPKNYVKRVNEKFNSIKSYNKLPEYNDDSECKYNCRVANHRPDNYIHMDNRTVSIPGVNAGRGIEVCDLYDKKIKGFIHVKIYRGSSVLSHLFNQGLVSGKLFKMLPEFREKVNDKLSTKDRNIKYLEEPSKSNEYKIIYAIINKNKSSFSIPFFSKISFVNCISTLEAMDYTVEIAKIPVSSTAKRMRLPCSSSEAK